MVRQPLIGTRVTGAGPPIRFLHNNLILCPTTKRSSQVRTTYSIQHGVHFDAFGVIKILMHPRTHVDSTNTVSDML
jgi:hypothetical protein